MIGNWMQKRAEERRSRLEKVRSDYCKRLANSAACFTGHTHSGVGPYPNDGFLEICEIQDLIQAEIDSKESS